MEETLAFPDLLRLIDERSTAFRAAVASAPSQDAQVPTCPEWTLFDLSQHLGEGRLSWTATAKAAPKGAPAVPREREALLAWSAASTQELLGGCAYEDVVMKGGRLRGESLCRASATPPSRPARRTTTAPIDTLVWCAGSTLGELWQRSGERGQATMQASEVPCAVAAAMSTASSLGLAVNDVIILNDSNKLTLRLLPCDVLARVAPVAHQVAQFEVELAQQLAESGCRVAALEPRVEPRVHERDGFAVTLWTYYGPVTPREVSPADYANALEGLHAGMRKLDVPTPHFTDRVEQAQQLVANRDRTPALADADRELLGDTLRRLRRVIGERGGTEQLLHGEPHPGNVLTTKNGLLFIDFETCCRGPVEFDLAHAPEEVSEHYPGVDQGLLRECRVLVLAMITTWRWDQGDQLPNGRRLGTEWLSQLRAALDRNGFDPHG